jgi:Ca2+-binding EF-hand superfamily protein
VSALFRLQVKCVLIALSLVEFEVHGKRPARHQREKFSTRLAHTILAAGISTRYSPIYTLMGSGATTDRSIPPEWMGIFSAMQFTKAEILSFQLIFNSVDINADGRIDVDELLSFLSIEKSLFAVRIFGAFDRLGTGKIDLFEFVVALWKFCALGNDSIGKTPDTPHQTFLLYHLLIISSFFSVVFAFDLYDTDCDGVLTETEMKVIFHDLYWYGREPSEDKKSRT